MKSYLFFIFSTLYIHLQVITTGHSSREYTHYRQNLQQEENVTTILNSIFNGYDDRVSPGSLIGRPLKINITLFVLHFVQLQETKQELTTQIYIRRWWHDPRLVHKGKTITLDGDHGSVVWSPDLFFAGDIHTTKHDFTKRNSYTRISSGGIVKISDRVTLTTPCRMMFTYFPYDVQICDFEIESYGYSTNEMILEWAEGTETSAGVAHSASQTDDFVYLGHRISSHTTHLLSGNYSRLVVEFRWIRYSCWHIWATHIPLAFLSLIAIIPLFSVCRSESVGIIWAPFISMFSALTSIILGLYTYQDKFKGNYYFLRLYIIMNWVFVVLTLLESATFAVLSKTKTCNKRLAEDSNSFPDCKLVIRDEMGPIVTFGIFILMNSMYWLTLWDWSRVDMGDGWILS